MRDGEERQRGERRRQLDELHGRQRRLARGGEEGPRPVFMVVMVQYIRIGDDDW
jgi:hypothetical protein